MREGKREGMQYKMKNIIKEKGIRKEDEEVGMRKIEREREKEWCIKSGGPLFFLLLNPMEKIELKKDEED